MPREKPVPPVLHRNLTLVITDDPLLYTELKADSKIGPLLLAHLAPEAGVALPDKAEGLVRSLLKSGHLPKVVEL
jgi:hypothetical protein